MNTFNLKTFPIEKKTVFLRVDYNVPVEDGQVTDHSKIRSSLPTIKFLLEKKCKIVLGFHLGRPGGKVVPELKADPLAQELQRLLPKEKIIKLNDCIGKDIKTEIAIGSYGKIFVLENLRFYKEEEKNNLAFAHSLASLAHVYVNEAFSNSHRRHASMEAITNFLPAMAGFQLEQEVHYLNQALKPKQPAVWIIGGAKLDKVKLIKQALNKASKVLIGGALAFPFLRAKGIKVGNSKVDPESIRLAKKLLSRKSNRKKIVLPLDFVVAEKLAPRAAIKIVDYNQIQINQVGLDIGPKTIEMFKQYLVAAKTIVWNGPLGRYEWAQFARGTKEIGRFLGRIEGMKICGGGETAEAVNKFHLAHNFTHVSTGGGAALMFLSGEKLPALAALEQNYKKFRKKVGFNRSKWLGIF
ncbi:MAG TPA: phosphoglycerate kinase [Candidatus Nanoarchaeia archaeon]|nr:phosphoglycerate kinase [Candidatus Nanoarchaeia archaeon]